MEVTLGCSIDTLRANAAFGEYQQALIELLVVSDGGMFAAVVK
jgi:hypothetical protein